MSATDTTGQVAIRVVLATLLAIAGVWCIVVAERWRAVARDAGRHPVSGAQTSG